MLMKGKGKDIERKIENDRPKMRSHALKGALNQSVAGEARRVTSR
jgi:hypothetical protein